MLVTVEHRQAIQKAIEPLDTENARQAYREGNFQRAELCKDVDMRYRWDLFWAARTSYPNLINPVLDAGYKDSDIDTALRSIVKELT